MWGLPCIKYWEGEVKDDIYAFQRMLRWIQAAFSMPCSFCPQQEEFADVQEFPLCKS